MLINPSARDNELTKWITEYISFVKIVENTPQSINRSHQWIRGFHGAIGLAGEANEVLQIFKKDLFGKNKSIQRPDIVNELGDCLWYLTLLCDAFNITLKELIDYNTTKLASRYAEKLNTENNRGEYIALREGRKIEEKEAGRPLDVDNTGDYVDVVAAAERNKKQQLIIDTFSTSLSDEDQEKLRIMLGEL